MGPGRGSGAGSIVAYALRITDLDPIPYNLLFERFLNPERVSMPDFDIDFCQDRRDEVIKYVGRASTARTTSGRSSPSARSRRRACCATCAACSGCRSREGDRIAKLVPEVLNITLKEAIEMEPRLKEMMEKPTVLGAGGGHATSPPRTCWRSPWRWRACTARPGMHAAGVVIADKPLWEFVPVYQPPGEKALITQFAKDEVEAAGLVKFDFLGLKTLTVIQHALDLVNRGRTPEQQILRAPDPARRHRRPSS